MLGKLYTIVHPRTNQHPTFIYYIGGRNHDQIASSSGNGAWSTAMATSGTLCRHKKGLADWCFLAVPVAVE